MVQVLHGWVYFISNSYSAVLAAMVQCRKQVLTPSICAAHVYLTYQEIIVREIAPTQPAALTIGRFTAGEAPNIIPEDGDSRGKHSYNGLQDIQIYL